jgi:DNA-binding IclR family transcriptional regulator
MAVKRSQSAGRVLAVFEAVSRAQPIGVSALARLLGADKSAIQRDLMTLADAGWIQPAANEARAWELSPLILSLARAPHSNESLRQQVRPALERLRDRIGETVYLTVPHQGQFVVIEALESANVLRVVQRVGIIVPVEGSASARAWLAALPARDRTAFLGHEPDAAFAAEIAAAGAAGFAVNDGRIVPGTVTFAAALLDAAARPVGTIVVTGPAERLAPSRWAEVTAQLCATAREAARTLSGPPAPDDEAAAAG